MTSEAYTGEIRQFGFNFASQDWAQCNGQLMSIQQNQALYAVIGTAFGGDGQTTFALPNLQGDAPLGAGTMTGGPTYTCGQAGGAASVSLAVSQLPSHIHGANGSGAPVTVNAPDASVLPGTFPTASNYSDTSAAPLPMGAATVGNAGGGLGHENQQPYIVLNFCICLAGEYPSRS